jgi:DHA2 family multidrug resistance protein
MSARASERPSVQRKLGPLPAHSAETYHAPFNPWLIAIVATLATFMEVLDTSIANVALPHIAGNLGASVSDSTWTLTSYLLANALVLPASAWLSAAIGRRNYYMLSVAMFTVSSLLCGFAPNLEMLVFFRLLQGLGGGGLQPLTQAILVDTFPPRQRGMGMAVYGMTVVVAPVIGPTFGGWITDNHDWRWIFFINVPIGLMALALSLRFITDPPYLPRRSGPARWRGDFIGLGLVALGLASLQLALDLGERFDWLSSPFIAGALVVAGLALLGGLLWEWNQREPMVDIRVLSDTQPRASCAHMLILALCCSARPRSCRSSCRRCSATRPERHGAPGRDGDRRPDAARRLHGHASTRADGARGRA